MKTKASTLTRVILILSLLIFHFAVKSQTTQFEPVSFSDNVNDEGILKVSSVTKMKSKSIVAFTLPVEGFASQDIQIIISSAEGKVIQSYIIAVAEELQQINLQFQSNLLKSYRVAISGQGNSAKFKLVLE